MEQYRKATINQGTKMNQIELSKVKRAITISEPREQLRKVQYCYRNIGQFNSHQELAVFLCARSWVLVSLPLCFIFRISFVDWLMASFLYCSPYSYRSSNYRDSDSCRSFRLLKAIAKTNGNLFAIASICEKEQSRKEAKNWYHKWIKED